MRQITWRTLLASVVGTAVLAGGVSAQNVVPAPTAVAPQAAAPMPMPMPKVPMTLPPQGQMPMAAPAPVMMAPAPVVVGGGCATGNCGGAVAAPCGGGCDSAPAGRASLASKLFGGFHNKPGTANPIGCGCLAAERTFAFGSCKQFFNPGRGCGSGGQNCGLPTYAAPYGQPANNCAGPFSYLNR